MNNNGNNQYRNNQNGYSRASQNRQTKPGQGYDPDELYTKENPNKRRNVSNIQAHRAVRHSVESVRGQNQRSITHTEKNVSRKTAPKQVGGAITKSAGNKAAVPKSRNYEKIKDTDLILEKSGVDRIMLIIIILLICFGSVMVFSASFADALDSTGDSLYYIKRQMVFIVIGAAVIFFICTVLNYRIIRVFTPLYFLILCGFLCSVLAVGIAKGKAQRWITIGFFNFQPSEFMKLGLVLMLAYFIERYQDRILDYKHFWRSSFWGVFMPLGIIGIVCFLIMLENHFSCIIIMFLIGLVVSFVGGARPAWIISAGGVGGVGVLLAILFTDYAKRRIDIWLHPENYSSLDDTWQTIQGKIAIGSGGFFGIGLGQSRQKYLFVSEPQNDFIFSIVCEELGFIGALMVIVLFALFVWRGLVIAFHAPDTFSSLVAIGIVSKIAIQVILNMMVVTAVIPNTGITLPFFSYGGSALISTMIECGVLLSISRYSYQEK